MRIFVSIVLLLAALGVQAQPYPSKPIRYIVPFAPGGMAPEDLLALMRSDIPRLGKVVRESGAKVD